MNSATPEPLRRRASLLSLFCGLLLIPACFMAYVGAGWLDLPWPGGMSAAAMTIAPLPLLMGTLLARRAAQQGSRSDLLKAALSAMIAILLYVVVWAWGGRMLI
jgi:hypothetical protein